MSQNNLIHWFDQIRNLIGRQSAALFAATKKIVCQDERNLHSGRWQCDGKYVKRDDVQKSSQVYTEETCWRMAQCQCFWRKNPNIHFMLRRCANGFALRWLDAKDYPSSIIAASLHSGDDLWREVLCCTMQKILWVSQKSLSQWTCSAYWWPHPREGFALLQGLAWDWTVPFIGITVKSNSLWVSGSTFLHWDKKCDGRYSWTRSLNLPF